MAHAAAALLAFLVLAATAAAQRDCYGAMVSAPQCSLCPCCCR